MWPAQTESAWTSFENQVTCLSQNCFNYQFMAQKRSGSWLKWSIIVLIIGAAVAGGVWRLLHGQNDVPQYQTATVGRDELTQLVTATGTLNPVVNVTVGSQVSGRISKLYVDYNSTVHSNEVIAEIDPSTYQAAVEQATADLANAKANLELQQVEAERAAQLFTNKLISGSDYDTAMAMLHEAEAMVKIKQASLSNSIVNLDYCKILSPVDGVVISRAVDLGQTVASSFNTPTLFQIANDLTKMQIDSSVAEADVGGVVEGQDVDFTVDAYPTRNFHGSVTQVRNSPTTVNNVVTYDCVIGVTNADYKLKPGMTANVSIIIAQRENALNIPNSALRFRPPDSAISSASTNAPAMPMAENTNSPSQRSGRKRGERMMVHTVYVLSGDEKNPVLQPVQIKTGITDGISTEVISGLNEGDRVITGMVNAGTTATTTSNPFGGGGMPRMR
jgi:HlyD family secretion protein